MLQECSCHFTNTYIAFQQLHFQGGGISLRLPKPVTAGHIIRTLVEEELLGTGEPVFEERLIISK
ncbi:MAG TPA: hypothetical protein DCK87_01800 [Desulfotomaculum sp.]|nr:hypothetical protein [Desulfotomaculum sp.]